MPRDYTSADFHLRGLASTRERQEAVSRLTAQRVSERNRQAELRERERREQAAFEFVRLRDQGTWEWYTQFYSTIYLEVIPEEEKSITNPILRKCKSLERRFKNKLLPKCKQKALPLP